MHKAANVLNKVPRSVQPGMKADLREVRDAPDRAQAEAAVAVFDPALVRWTRSGRHALHGGR